MEGEWTPSFYHRGGIHMKILITGFEPFNGETINPAYEAVRRLPNRIDGAQLIKQEIPVIFDEAANQVYHAICQENPEIVLCVGQAGGSDRIRVEFVAINHKDAGICDNAGQKPEDELIKADGDTAYFTKLPVKSMVKTLSEAGIPAVVSYSAGTYVCNDVFYQLLYHIDKSFPHVMGGFIHVPYANEQVIDKIGKPSLSIETMSQGLELCMRQIMKEYRKN